MFQKAVSSYITPRIVSSSGIVTCCVEVGTTTIRVGNSTKVLEKYGRLFVLFLSEISDGVLYNPIFFCLIDIRQISVINIGSGQP